MVGIAMSQWLGQARLVEQELESTLQRDDLTHPQRAKVGELLSKVRSYLARQLDRINSPEDQGASKP
jgi:hypothetical protein